MADTYSFTKNPVATKFTISKDPDALDVILTKQPGNTLACLSKDLGATKVNVLKGAGAAALIDAQGVNTTNVDSYFEKSVAGYTNGKTGTFSTWVYYDAIHVGVTTVVAETTNSLVRFRVSSLKKPQLRLRNAGNTLNVLNITGLNSFNENQWNHLIVSWDINVATQDCVMVVNGTIDSASATFNDEAAGYADGTLKMIEVAEMGLAGYAFSYDYIDLSVQANIDKFITTGLKPVDLLVTNPVTLLDYYSAPDFTVNKGSLGDLTQTGANHELITGPNG